MQQLSNSKHLDQVWLLTCSGYNGLHIALDGPIWQPSYKLHFCLCIPKHLKLLFFRDKLIDYWVKLWRRFSFLSQTSCWWGNLQARGQSSFCQQRLQECASESWVSSYQFRSLLGLAPVGWFLFHRQLPLWERSPSQLWYYEMCSHSTNIWSYNHIVDEFVHVLRVLASELGQLQTLYKCWPSHPSCQAFATFV